MAELVNSDAVMIDDQVASDSSEPVLPPSAFFRHTDFETDPVTGSESSVYNPQPPVLGGYQPDEYSKTFGDLSPKSKQEAVTDSCSLDPEYARKVLDRLSSSSEGWCQLVRLAPTKKGGYIQVSFGGANKFTTLEQVVLWANGESLLEGEQCSHLCHKPSCRTVGHVVGESVIDNNSRKGCLVWIQCHHCSKLILLCMHDPCCIKFHEDYASMDDLIDNGVCRVLRDESQDTYTDAQFDDER